MKAVKYQPKSQIKLEDLLRRRKSSLKDFIKDRGITTYEGLDTTCKRLGVITPPHGLFIECVDHYVSNPSAGVVVVPPALVIEEATGSPKVATEDKFENLQPQISVTDVKDDNEFSVVLQEASVTKDNPDGAFLTKKQRKAMKKQETNDV